MNKTPENVEHCATCLAHWLAQWLASAEARHAAELSVLRSQAEDVLNRVRALRRAAAIPGNRREQR
jgi:hypothetical protein